MKKSLLLLPILLMACAKQPESPAQSIFLVQSDYAVALRVELAYSKLPRCAPKKIIKPCSEASTIRKVQKIDDAAWVAIKSAQAAVRTPGYGENKIITSLATASALTKAFVEITYTLGVP